MSLSRTVSDILTVSCKLILRAELGYVTWNDLEQCVECNKTVYLLRLLI